VQCPAQWNICKDDIIEMRNEKITIIGAGISGLVAAINLAKAGFSIEVLEKQNRIGGSPAWHPSVHHQVLDIDKTSKYIGINIAQCFRPVKRHVFDFYGRKVILHDPKNSWVCEKGSRSTSIETYLHSEASQSGVRFIFMDNVDLDRISKIILNKSRCIVSTGLERGMYEELGIKHELVQGFRGSVNASAENVVYSYFGKYTNHDFAYVASFDQLRFSLLFARRGINNKDLDTYKKHLKVNADIEFDNWEYSTGCIPLEINLKKKNAILAGTISGMIDPFYLNGISGALISGRIAAMYFMDTQTAVQAFNLYSRNFQIKKLLKHITERLPSKKISFPIMSKINDLFSPVGVATK
jgi:flavin-dependent dehydrogenase